jgi:hypothetical protein
MPQRYNMGKTNAIGINLSPIEVKIQCLFLNKVNSICTKERLPSQ